MSDHCLSEAEREELANEFTEVVRFYCDKVKEVITAAEREDEEQRMVITCAIELRSAFDHVARSEAALRGILTDEHIKRSGHSLFAYCKSNLDKAKGHLYRAAYDAYDIIGVTLTDRIQQALDRISPKTLYEVVADATDSIVVPFQSAKNLFTQAKLEKDVAGQEITQVEFSTYEDAVNRLLDVKSNLQAHMPKLVAFERDKKRKQLSTILFASVGWLIAIASIVIALLK